MASPSSAVALPGVEDELLAMLRAELTGEEQCMFVDGFAAYLKHDARRDFVIDLDGSREWLGFSTKANAKKAVVKHLKEGVHFIHVDECTEVSLDRTKNVLLTVHGFKQLCMAANTDKARKVRDYYIAMEEVMFEYTRCKMTQHEAALAMATQQLAIKDTEASEAKQLAATQAAELERYRAKTYEEVPKLDKCYVHKEASELDSDRHKIGKAIDETKREATFSTALAQGGKMLHAVDTHNAVIVEKVIQVVMKRYHYVKEHYQCRTEHSINMIDAVCTMIDTLASCYEHITREDMFGHLVDNIMAKVDDDGLGEPVSDDDDEPAAEPQAAAAGTSATVATRDNQTNKQGLATSIDAAVRNNFQVTLAATDFVTIAELKEISAKKGIKRLTLKQQLIRKGAREDPDCCFDGVRHGRGLLGVRYVDAP